MIRTIAIAAALTVIGSSAAVAQSAAPAPAGKIQISCDTADKLQSKLWRDQGSWWAALPQEQGVYLWRYADAKFEAQPVPGALKDTKADSRCDVLMAGDTLLVLAFSITAQEASLHALKFADGAYKELPSYPVKMSNLNVVAGTATGQVATMVMDMDSTGLLWISYVNTAQEVLVQTLQVDKPEAGLSKPFVLGSGTGRWDVSAVAAFKDHIGVFWSSTKQTQFVFRAHMDGQPIDKWTDRETMSEGKGSINEHINTAVATDGSLWIVTKSATGPIIGPPHILLRHRSLDGRWDIPIEINVDKVNKTRPVMMLDGDKPVAYVLYANRAKPIFTICMRRVSLTDQKVGDEEVLLSTDYSISNPTDTKCLVTKTTGLMVLAGAYEAKLGPGMYRLLPLGDAD